MGSRIRQHNTEKVYEAAELWVERALKSDDSLFTPGKPIWSSHWLNELRERFLDQPDSGSGSFIEKLKRQLDGSPDEVYQLMGEALYVHLLIVEQGTMKTETKKNMINRVLDWAPAHLEVPDYLVDSFASGIAGPGTFYMLLKHYEIGFLIEFAEQWKSKSGDEQGRLLDDPWAFKDFVMNANLNSRLFRNRSNASSRQRNALLHLLHPDTFEGVVSAEHKRLISEAESFIRYVQDDTEDRDRRIQQIRQGIKAERRAEFSTFYDDDIHRMWDPAAPSAWDVYVRRARAYMGTGNLGSQEIDYKLDLSAKLATAREAVIAGADDWISHVERELPSENPLGWRTKGNFCRWMRESPNDALQALQAIWTQDDLPVTERIRAFSDLLPKSAISGAGTRATLVSVLLMGTNVEDCPPYRFTAFNEAYRQTEYDQPESGADETTLYSHALGFLDRFIDEAQERGLQLRNRLEAQSLVWALHQGRDEYDPPLPEPPSLLTLSGELNLPVTFLEKIQSLLEEKKQVIFQGPPGTGKTYVAQKLAKHLAGWESEERVKLVQFHPSYAYEDFVQGYRPMLKDGQAGFELNNGPLVRIAENARADSGGKYYLIIDEINRGNLAKVLGELYFLLEYRDEAIELQYSDESFRLPKNLYIIGTMNTADRSIALVDLALRRRFYFVEFHPDKDPIKGLLKRWLEKNKPDMIWIADVVDEANRKLSDRNAAIGPSYFMKPSLDEEMVKRIWEHSVIPYIQEQLFGDDERIAEFALSKLWDRDASPAYPTDETDQTQDDDTP